MAWYRYRGQDQTFPVPVVEIQAALPSQAPTSTTSAIFSDHNMKIELNIKSGDAKVGLPAGLHAYEQIFNLYLQDSFVAYNIIKTIKIPQDIRSDMIETVRVNGKMSWTQISFDVYGTIKLWWLICLTNKILNPVIMPVPGIVLKTIKSEHIPTIMSHIRNQL